MDTKALRQKILDLAIRGKLVPQNPDDEPASVLLERIRAEKQQMVKDGKLKAKDIKNDTIIFKGEDSLHYEKFPDGTVKCIQDEIPFELPDGWEWCRLGCVFNICSSKRVLQADWKKEGIPFYRAREIVRLSNEGYVKNDIFISEEHYNELKKSCGVPNPGDLMVTGVGTIGKVYMVGKSDRFYYKDASVLCFANFSGFIFSEYFRHLLDSSLLQKQIHGKTYGNTVNTITINIANNYLCAIPPLNEQHQIVKAINKYINIISSLETNIEDIQTNIITAKSKILDLAIRGKLVPQNPDDEPASVLLERIRAEKEELIKQGKIKRDKKESVIFKGDDNSYHKNIPQNWEISTLSELTTSLSLNDGDWILSDNMSENGSVKLIQLGSVGKMKYINKGFKYISEETFDKLNCTQIHSGYILINRIIADSMNLCILPDIDGKLITTVDTCWIEPQNDFYNVKYLMYALSAPIIQSDILLQSSGTTRKRISKNNLIKIQFPLPPLAEQHRNRQPIS